MAHVTLFSLTSCGYCHRAKQLLATKGFVSPPRVVDISLSAADDEDAPRRRAQLEALVPPHVGDRLTLPQIWLGRDYLGGFDELAALERAGELDARLAALAVDASDEARAFPPPPPPPLSKQAALDAVPDALRARWQQRLEQQLDAALGGNVASLLVMLELDEHMVVLCTAGDGASIYRYGDAGEKQRGDDDRLYCQVALEAGASLFVDDARTHTGLRDNEDLVKFGFVAYAGAPWRGPRGSQLAGTVAAMERRVGVLRREHLEAIEAFRDELQRELREHWATSAHGAL